MLWYIYLLIYLYTVSKYNPTLLTVKLSIKKTEKHSAYNIQYRTTLHYTTLKFQK